MTRSTVLKVLRLMAGLPLPSDPGIRYDGNRMMSDYIAAIEMARATLEAMENANDNSRPSGPWAA